MTPAELRKIIKCLRISQVACAKKLGVDPRTMRRWLAGDAAIPKQTQLLMQAAKKRGVETLDA